MTHEELDLHLSGEHGVDWDLGGRYSLTDLQYEHLRAHVRDRKAGIEHEPHGSAGAFPEGKQP